MIIIAIYINSNSKNTALHTLYFYYCVFLKDTRYNRRIAIHWKYLKFYKKVNEEHTIPCNFAYLNTAQHSERGKCIFIFIYIKFV